MSYILDALRESQTCRQLSEAPVPPPGVTGGAPVRPNPLVRRFLAPSCMVLAAVIVSYLVLQPSPSAKPSTPIKDVRGTDAAADTPPALETTATTPAVVESSATVDKPSTIIPAAMPTLRNVPSSAVPATAAGPRPGGNIPAFAELSAPYRGSHPRMEVQVHVYDNRPAYRFVMINQHKYREGQRTADGPVVEEITRQGVVMLHAGRRFRLNL